MATGPQHYADAESDLDRAARASDRGRDADAAFWMQSAQVHATLALAAATALVREGVGGTLPAGDRAAWFSAASEHNTASRKAKAA